MENFFKKSKSTLTVADNGEERLNINNNVYRKTADNTELPAEPQEPISEPEIEPQEVDDPQQITPIIVIAQQSDKKTDVLLNLIQKALSLL